MAQVGHKVKKAQAKAQRLAQGWEPKGVEPWKCTVQGCGSEATRFVYQHGHKSADPNEKNRSAVVRWELPAYRDGNTPLKWKCPLCNYEVSPILVKCGACGSIYPPKS